MGLDWTIGGCIMLGIIANSWRRFIGFDAVVFDGTNDYLDRTTAVTTAGKQLTFSCWFYPLSSDSGTTRPFWWQSLSGSSKGWITIGTDNKIAIVMYPPSGGILINWASVATVTHDVWNHLVFSFDMATDNFEFYLNDLVDAIPPTLTNTDVAFNSDKVWLMTDLLNNDKMVGDLSELYWTDEYIDLSIEANRRKFISATGTPVDLGADGSAPTSTAALIYYSGAASVWNAGTNAGSGGDFTMTGVVTDSSNEPVELP